MPAPFSSGTMNVADGIYTAFEQVGPFQKLDLTVNGYSCILQLFYLGQWREEIPVARGFTSIPGLGDSVGYPTGFRVKGDGGSSAVSVTAWR